MSVKRRAPPKLFRTRRLASGEVVLTQAGPEVTARALRMQEERQRTLAIKRQQALMGMRRPAERCGAFLMDQMDQTDNLLPMGPGEWEEQASSTPSPSRGAVASQECPIWSAPAVTTKVPIQGNFSGRWTTGVLTPANGQTRKGAVPSPTEILRAMETNRLRASISTNLGSALSGTGLSDIESQPWLTSTHHPPRCLDNTWEGSHIEERFKALGSLNNHYPTEINSASKVSPKGADSTRNIRHLIHPLTAIHTPEPVVQIATSWTDEETSAVQPLFSSTPATKFKVATAGQWSHSHHSPSHMPNMLTYGPFENVSPVFHGELFASPCLPDHSS